VSSFSALSLRKSLQPKEIKFGRHFLKIGLFLEDGAKALYGRNLRAPVFWSRLAVPSGSTTAAGARLLQTYFPVQKGGSLPVNAWRK